jgi:hypothetical protein
LRYFFITYVKQRSGKIDEMVSIGKQIKKSDITMTSVIMDFKLRKVEKCLVDGKVLDTDFDNLYIYYKKIYPAIFERLAAENGWTGEVESPITEEVTDITSEHVE